MGFNSGFKELNFSLKYLLARRRTSFLNIHAILHRNVVTTETKPILHRNVVTTETKPHNDVDNVLFLENTKRHCHLSKCCHLVVLCRITDVLDAEKFLRLQLMPHREPALCLHYTCTCMLDAEPFLGPQRVPNSGL